MDDVVAGSVCQLPCRGFHVKELSVQVRSRSVVVFALSLLLLAVATYPAPARSDAGVNAYTQLRWRGTVEFTSVDTTRSNGWSATTISWSGTLRPSDVENTVGQHVVQGAYTEWSYDDYTCPPVMQSQTTTAQPILYLIETNGQLKVGAGAGGDTTVIHGKCEGGSITMHPHAPLTTPVSGLGCSLPLGTPVLGSDGLYRVDGTQSASCYDGLITQSVEVHLVADPQAENRAPLAREDSASTTVNRTVDVPVTANDSDPDGDAIGIQSCTIPSGVGMTIVGSSARVSPPPGYFGTFSFHCTVVDTRGLTATALVTVHVGGTLSINVGIEHQTYWYNEIPNLAFLGRTGSDKLIVTGRSSIALSGSGEAAVKQVCVSSEWRVAVDRNFSTVPSLWTIGGRDINSEVHPVWEDPRQARGGSVSVVKTRAPQCLAPGLLDLVFRPGRMVARTVQLGKKTNFTAVGNRVTAHVQLSDGKWYRWTIDEKTKAAKKPPATKDLDERENFTLELR